MSRALSVFLPKWPVQRILRQWTKTNAPFAERHERFVLLLSSRLHGQQFVSACCGLAEEQGVRIGMTLAHARSLLRGHRVEVRDFASLEDRETLQRVAIWALRFTPIVAVDEPDGLLMDIAGCEHLYGGDRRMAQRMSQAMDRLGLQHRIAVGPTYAASRAVARFRDERLIVFDEDELNEMLTGLPLAALQIDSNIGEALYAVGVQRIDQLLELPREALAARYGAGMLLRLDQMLGTATELIQPVREPDPFSVTYAFDGPVIHLAAIEATAKELLGSLTRKLMKACLGIARLTLHLLRIDTPPERMTWTFTRPTHDFPHIWSLVHPRLERVHLGFGVEVITLQALRLSPLKNPQGALWADDASSNMQDAASGALLDRLIERLGPSAVTCRVPVASRIPERSFLCVGSDEMTKNAIKAAAPASRPTRLFEVPQLIEVIAHVQDGPPAQLVWKSRTLTVHASFGPERITERWWAKKRSEDQRPAESRDYFTVLDERGRWLWLFRRSGTRQWFVHGEWS